MRYYFIYILIFLQSICSIFPLQAEPSDSLSLNYPYINYTTKDGLPSNETFCVFQDSRGYIWIGTDRGLVKYDGYEFKTYTTLDGLTDNVILAINEDDKGNLWYTGLNNVQLGFIDPNMDFHVYEHYNVLIDSIANKEPLIKGKKFKNIHFNEIHFNEKDIYLVNKAYGYSIVNAEGIKRVQLDFKKETTKTNYFTQGNVNFIYSNKCDVHVRNHKNDISINEKYINSYTKGNSIDIFPTFLTKDTTKYIYDGKDYLVISPNTFSHKSFEYRNSAYEITHNMYLFSTYGHPNKLDEIYISTSPDINKEKHLLFKGERTVSVIEDFNGGVWIATLRSGVLYFPGLESRNVLLNSPVEYMFLSDQDIIYGKRSLKYKFNKSSVKNINHNILTNHEKIHSKRIAFSNSTDIYLLDSLSSKRNKGERYIKGVHYLSDSLKYIYEFSKIYKVLNDQYFTVFPTNKDVYGSIYIESLYCFNSDSCLLGTRSGIYSFSKGELIHLDKLSTNERIKDLVYIPKYDVLVYVVLGEGVRIQLSNGRVLDITEEEGLISNMVNQLVLDENNELWLTTNKGLNKLIFSDQNSLPSVVTVLKSSKVLSSPNILQLIVEDSILYLGTDSGFDVVDIKTLDKKKSDKMFLFIDNILINKKNQSNPNLDFNLEYDENNVNIQYKAIAFNQFGNIEYRYRLQGLSDDWIYTKQREVSFLQLNPGEYIFKLEVQNDHGNWVNLQNEPHFKIHKPYWKTWWFIGGIGLILLSIGGGALYYYISNLKKEKTFIEDKQKLSESLNESRQKALSAQLNPHFVFNSLNSIQNFILTKRTELSSDYLSMFSKLMRYVFENSKSLYVSLIDEIEALKLYLELEQVRHNHKFKYIIKHTEVNINEAMLPALLIQPIIENAIWHGLLHKTNDDRLLEVLFSSNHSDLKIEVRDNGVGRGIKRPKQKFIKKQRSSGVELTKQRLSLLGQSIDSKTNFEIIDLFNSSNEAIGTSVIITIPLIRESNNVSK